MKTKTTLCLLFLILPCLILTACQSSSTSQKNDDIDISGAWYSVSKNPGEHVVTLNSDGSLDDNYGYTGHYTLDKDHLKIVIDDEEYEYEKEHEYKVVDYMDGKAFQNIPNENDVYSDASDAIVYCSSIKAAIKAYEEYYDEMGSYEGDISDGESSMAEEAELYGSSITFADYIMNKDAVVFYQSSRPNLKSTRLDKKATVNSITVFEGDTVTKYNDSHGNHNFLNLEFYKDDYVPSGCLGTLGELSKLGDDEVIRRLKENVPAENIVSGKWKLQMITDETGNNVKFETFYVNDEPTVDNIVFETQLDMAFTSGEIYDSTFTDFQRFWVMRNDNNLEFIGDDLSLADKVD